MAGLSTPQQFDHPTTLAAAVLTDSNRLIVVVIGVVALAALAVAGVLVRQVLAAGEGTDSMKKIAAAVQEGANAYLARQLRTLGVFAVVVFFLLLLLPADDWNQRAGRSVFFLIGAVFSAATGYIGMWLAVRSNVRVAAAAREATPAEGEPEKDLTAVSHKAMKIAFRTGGVVGMFTVGLGLLGASCVVLVYAADAPKVLEGFGLGAALIAMFMRVGGGIFTKAADVGADLVGKVEQGIPEDDPRNAATIADNVGDNVGDCAGMAADLFESYAVTLVAALILGKAAFGDSGLAFPLIVPAIGVVTAMIGIFAVAPRRTDRSGMSAINRGFFVSAVISLALVAAAVFMYLPSSYADLKGISDAAIRAKDGDPRILALVAVAIGIVLAALIQQLTGYFTETTRRPVRDIGKTSLTGPATVVLAGISVGLESAVYTALLIGARCVRGVPARRYVDHARPLRGGAGRYGPAHHGRRDRRHGHLRSGLRQRAGHRRDVRRRGGLRRAGADRSGRGGQHHEGDHQGHRHRHRRPRGLGALRLVSRRDHHGRTGRGREGRERRAAEPGHGHLPAQQPGRPHRGAAVVFRSRGWRSTRCPGPRARWSSRCAGSSGRSPGS